jgi:CRISPR-associated protein Cas5d
MPYPVSFEISGPAAMFTRPDTGAAPISYPVPTWSACKAMFESVARGFFARGCTPAIFSPTKLELLNPIRYERFVTNYRGPLREQKNIAKGASYQLQATILVDVRYRVHADCLRIAGRPDDSGNAPHALQEMFNRRLAEGKSKYAPSLGWKEFLPSYFGPIRDETSPAPVNEQIPAFLLSVWDAPVNGQYQPSFCIGEIKSGLLTFPTALLVNGKLKFQTH